MQQQGMQTIDDDAPIAMLYQRYAPLILAYVRRHGLSREDAEDLLFEVFLAALEHEKLADFNDDKQRAWLLRVARNKLIDARRLATSHPVVPLDDEWAEALDDADDLAPEQVALRQEEHEQLRRNIARLPAPHQEILRLRFSLGLRYAEIAARLQKSEGAIRVLLSRSLHALRRLYHQQEGGSSTDDEAE